MVVIDIDKQEMAWYMLQDLKSRRLEVVIVDCCRRVISQNPRWYQELCAAYVSWRRRRWRTIIKRKWVIATLKRMASGEDVQTIYANRLEDFMAGGDYA